MSVFKRVAALFLAAVLLCLSLSLLSCTSAQTKQEQKVIGTCAGYDVRYEELRYVTLTYKDLFASTYGATIWDTEESAEQYRAELEETVWRLMLNNYAVLALCAQYMPDASLNSSTITDSVDSEIEDAIDSYGSKSAFAAALTELYMTENFLRFCLKVSLLENELLYVLTDDLGLIMDDTDEFLSWLEDGNCAYVQHVYIRNDVGDSVEENRTRAENVRKQLLEGTDISVFINSSINEDTSNTAPYYLVRDVYAEEIENAALSLQNVGDVSEVVETSDGFYIFVRMEDSTARLLSNLSSLLQSYQWAIMEKMVDEVKAGLSIELNDYGKSLDLLTIE